MLDRGGPFTPLRGIDPPVLAGRADLLAGVARSLHGLGDADEVQPQLIVGPLGAGKTVALAHLARQLGDLQGWLAPLASVAADGDLFRPLTAATAAAAGHLAQLGDVQTANAVAAEANGLAEATGGQSLTAGPAAGGYEAGQSPLRLLFTFLNRLGEHVGAGGHAIVFLLDDLHHAADSLIGALFQAVGDAARRLRRVAVVGASTVVVPGGASDHGLAPAWGLRPLRDELMGDALRPVAFSPAALVRVSLLSGGLPALVQCHAAAALAARGNADRPVLPDDLENTRHQAVADHAAAFLEPHLDHVPPAGRRYLLALAGLGPGAHPADVVRRGVGVTRRLGPPTPADDPRADLIRRGLVICPDDRLVQLVLPGLAEAVVRRWGPTAERRAAAPAPPPLRPPQPQFVPPPFDAASSRPGLLANGPGRQTPVS